MKKLLTMILATMLVLVTSCSKTGMETQAESKANSTQSVISPASTTGPGSIRGNGSAIPAYYDARLFTIHFSEFSPSAEASLIAHNRNINFIYQSDNGLPNNQPFISVINAIPGDGFNPIWREVQIVFNQGFTSHQLYSDNEVLAAASGTHPEITLDTTNEVYWCPVVGSK